MIALVIVLLSILIVDYYKDNRVQSDIDVKFMSDYGNLTIGIYCSFISEDQDEKCTDIKKQYYLC